LENLVLRLLHSDTSQPHNDLSFSGGAQPRPLQRLVGRRHHQESDRRCGGGR
jgi:hypothetical protein